MRDIMISCLTAAFTRVDWMRRCASYIGKACDNNPNPEQKYAKHNDLLFGADHPSTFDESFVLKFRMLR